LYIPAATIATASRAEAPIRNNRNRGKVIESASHCSRVGRHTRLAQSSRIELPLSPASRADLQEYVNARPSIDCSRRTEAASAICRSGLRRGYPSCFLLTAYRKIGHTAPVGYLMGKCREDKAEVLQGTLILLVLRTLEALGPMHGYGIARRIEQISKDVLQLNQGTLYPALLRMEQEGWIASKWGLSEKNRKARFYSITKPGRSRLAREAEDWKRMSSTIERFLDFDPASLAEEGG
jgi:PadR family transcriptional regulator PadR